MAFSLDKLLSYYPPCSQILSNVEAEYIREIHKRYSQNSSGLTQADSKIISWIKTRNFFNNAFQYASALCGIGAVHSAINITALHLFDFAYGIPDTSELHYCCKNGMLQPIEDKFEKGEELELLIYQIKLFTVSFVVLRGAASIFSPNAAVAESKQGIDSIEKKPRAHKEKKANDTSTTQWEALKNIKCLIADKSKNFEMLGKLIEVELAIAPGQCRYDWNTETAKKGRKYLAMFLCVKEKMFRDYAGKISYTKPPKGIEIPDRIYEIASDDRFRKNLFHLREAIIIDLINEGAISVDVKNSVIERDIQKILLEVRDFKKQILPLHNQFSEIFANVKDNGP